MNKFKLEDIFSLLPIHIYWKDKSGKYLGCNKLQAQSAGFASPEMMLDKTDYDLLPADQADKIRLNDISVMESNKIVTFEEDVILPSTHLPATFLSQKKPLYDDFGNVIGILGISIDITERRRLEDKLSQTESIFENIISLMPEHVYWKDLKGVLLGCNDTMAQSFGKPKEYLIGKTAEGILTPEQIKIVNAVDKEVIRTGLPYTAEEPATLANGTEAIFLSKKVPLRDKKENTIGVLGVSFNITERKNLEKQISEAKKEVEQANLTLANIITLMPGHVYWKDINGNYLGCNELQAKYLGLSKPEEIIGKTDYDLTSPEQAKAYREIDHKVISTGKPYAEEAIDIQADGTHKVFLTQKVPLHDINGKISGVVGTSIDITDRKNLEIELYEAKKRIEMTLENVIAMMPGFVYWLDRNNIYLGCNDVMAKLVGLNSREEIIGKRNCDLPSSKELAEYLDNVNNEIMEQGEPQSIEEFIKFADGNGRTFLSKKVPLKNEDGKVIGLLGISFDITERKRMEDELRKAKEKAERANQAKSEFLAVMSHELRTPLNAVIGLTQKLLQNKEGLSAQLQEEYLNTILDSGRVQLRLINDILDFVSLETGKFKFIIAPFAIAKLFDDLNYEYANSAEKKGIKFILTHTFSRQDKLVGDSHRIYQIIANLINNAFKFTDKGQVTVAIKHKLIEADTKADITITVQDTGIGIPKEYMRKIFKKFVQIRSFNKEMYTRENDGVGLGLSIVKKFIEQMGGNISVESELGKGTQFTCQLTLAKADILDGDKDNRFDSLPEINLSRYNILLVEDHPINQKVIISILHDFKGTVDIAADGKTALNLLKDKQYDLVFMDVSLPDMSGLAVTRQFRKIEKKPKSTRIIALTAHALEDDRKICLDAGMNDYLEKPFEIAKLIAILQKWLLN